MSNLTTCLLVLLNNGKSGAKLIFLSYFNRVPTQVTPPLARLSPPAKAVYRGLGGNSQIFLLGTTGGKWVGLCISEKN